MILLLNFSISSTIRASNAQKPKPENTLCACADFFHGALSIRNATETYKKIADFLVGSKYEKWCKFIKNVVLGEEQNLKTNIFSNPKSLKLSFAPGRGRFHVKGCILGHPNVNIFLGKILLMCILFSTDTILIGLYI